MRRVLSGRVAGLSQFIGFFGSCSKESPNGRLFDLDAGRCGRGEWTRTGAWHAGELPKGIAETDRLAQLVKLTQGYVRGRLPWSGWRECQCAGHDLRGDVDEGAIVGPSDSLPKSPELLVSVCDLAREADLPDAERHIHWSIPDPVAVGRIGAFRSAFDDIEHRVDSLIP